MSHPMKSADVRKMLGHPVVDADGHYIETMPVLKPFLIDSVREIAGGDLAKRIEAGAAGVRRGGSERLNPRFRSRSSRTQLLEQPIPHRVVHIAGDPGAGARLRRHVGVERHDVGQPGRPVQVEVRQEAVLVAAVPDHVDALVTFDEEGQGRMNIGPTAAFTVAGTDDRLPHLFE